MKLSKHEKVQVYNATVKVCVCVCVCVCAPQCVCASCSLAKALSSKSAEKKEHFVFPSLPVTHLQAL